VDSQAERRQERSFQVHAENAGTVRLGRHLAEGCEELLFRGGDERRQEGGDAGLEDGVGRGAIPLGVGREKVDACEAVDLEVDEARNGDTPAVRRRQAEAGDTAAENLEVAGNELPVDDGRFDA